VVVAAENATSRSRHNPSGSFDQAGRNSATYYGAEAANGRPLDTENSRFRGDILAAAICEEIASRLEAVRNALQENFSNGPVESRINRLKALKRQMYGRTGFELPMLACLACSSGPHRRCTNPELDPN
jgi:hypothetical protein